MLGRSGARQWPLTAKTAVILMGILLFLFPMLKAEAHATLVEMEPAKNEITKDSLSELTLRFNEPIEHDLATVTLYDADAKLVFTGNPEGGVKKSSKLTFSLPDLENGTYTVKWKVISADGHPVNGSYAFSLGQATEDSVNTTDNNSSEWALIIARIVPEALIMLTAGLIWFSWRAEKRKYPSLNMLWIKGRRIGAVFIGLGMIAELAVYALSLPSGVIQNILSGEWELLQGFPFILMVLAQIILLILVIIPGMERGWYLALWLLLAAAPAFGGHVWSMESPAIALLPRVIHQLAIAFWLGALAYVILILIWQKRYKTSISWKTFRPFFVKRMIASSGLVVLSGIIMVYLQTGITALFTDWKTWSAVVIIKVILTVLMGSLALYQTLKWKKLQTFTTGNLIRMEWLTGLIVIVLGVWLSQISYPIAVDTYDEALVSNQMEANIYIDQLQTGDQTMIANISKQNGKDPENVQVKVTMPQHNMDSDNLTARENKDGDYIVELPFTMSGTWQLKIAATYPDREKFEWQDEIFIAGKEN